MPPRSANRDPDPPRLVRVVHSADVALQAPPSVLWCVEGLFSRPSLNLIVGDPGSKKSLLALDLAVSVALGRPWLGLPVSQSPVLYVDEESGLHRFWKRANASLTGHQAAKGTPFHFISPGSYDFHDVLDVYDLAGHAGLLRAKLIVIDALVDVIGGGDENNVPSILPIFANLRQLAQRLQAAVVILHHNNKQGSFRGSSSISAAVDLMLSIESLASSPLIHVSPLKAREVFPQPISALAHFKEDRFYLSKLADQPLAKLSKLDAAILGHLKHNGETTTPGLMHALATNTPGSVRKAVFDLKATGFIQRNNSGFRGNVASFALTSKGDLYAQNLSS